MFENGRTLEDISSMSDDSTLVIKRTLHRYSILNTMLENYSKILPNSTYLKETIDTKLDTELILQRMYSYYIDELGLNLSFSDKEHTLLLPQNKDKKKQLIKILVLVAKMHWEDKLIDTRVLNTQLNIYSFFNISNLSDRNNILNDTHQELLETLKKYKDNDNNKEKRVIDEPEPGPKPKPDPKPKPVPKPEPKPGTYELFLELKPSRKKVVLYNDFNLLELIDRATDSTLQDLSSKVIFNTEQDNLIKDSIFSGDAPRGIYHIQAKIEHNKKSISKSATIEVYIPKSKINTNKPNNDLFTSVTAFALEEVEIDINYTVNTLINEIQSLKTPEENHLMIASSVRQLIELSVTKIIADKNLTNHGNPKNNLMFLIDEKLKEKPLFTNICNGDNKIKYEATKNLIGSIDASQLWDYLNLITHDSYSSIYSDLVEKINKQITPLLVVFHNYLKLQNS